MNTLRKQDLPHYTYADYALWEGDWELIDGVPYAMSPSPIIQHQRISSKISRQLEEIFENCQQCQVLLAIDWKIDDDTVVQPDNLVICHQPKNEKYLAQAPEIIFEILSPATARQDETIKFNLYEKEGVKYYIIVNGKEKIAKVYQLANGKYIKIADFSRDLLTFDIKHCGKVDFDFAKLWAKT